MSRPSLGGLATPPWITRRELSGASMAGVTTYTPAGSFPYAGTMTIASSGSEFTFTPSLPNTLANTGSIGALKLADVGAVGALTVDFEANIPVGYTTDMVFGPAIVDAPNDFGTPVLFGTYDLISSWGITPGAWYPYRVNLFGSSASLSPNGVFRDAQAALNATATSAVWLYALCPNVGLAQVLKVRNVLLRTADYGGRPL